MLHANGVVLSDTSERHVTEPGAMGRWRFSFEFIKV
jgi:hypothetical protein